MNGKCRKRTEKLLCKSLICEVFNSIKFAFRVPDGNSLVFWGCSLFMQKYSKSFEIACIWDSREWKTRSLAMNQLLALRMIHISWWGRKHEAHFACYSVQCPPMCLQICPMLVVEKIKYFGWWIDSGFSLRRLTVKGECERNNKLSLGFPKNFNPKLSGKALNSPTSRRLDARGLRLTAKVFNAFDEVSLHLNDKSWFDQIFISYWVCFWHHTELFLFSLCFFISSHDTSAAFIVLHLCIFPNDRLPRVFISNKLMFVAWIW